MADVKIPQYWPGQYGGGVSDIFPFDKVRDTVTGIEGKVVAQYNYPNGCVRYEIARVMNDGKIDDPVFDSQQLEVLERAHPENTDEARAAARERVIAHRAEQDAKDKDKPGGPPVKSGVPR